jgi:hypothetical protein
MTGENLKNSDKKPVPVPLCPPQLTHGLTQARTWASAMRGQRITTRAMEQHNLAEDKEFLRAIKIRSTTYFGGEVKA